MLRLLPILLIAGMPAHAVDFIACTAEDGFGFPKEVRLLSNGMVLLPQLTLVMPCERNHRDADLVGCSWHYNAYRNETILTKSILVDFHSKTVGVLELWTAYGETSTKSHSVLSYDLFRNLECNGAEIDWP